MNVRDLSGNGVITDMGAYSSHTNQPSVNYETVTASDSAFLKSTSREIAVTTQGDLTVLKLDGTIETITDAVGTLPIAARKIMTTGTTASGLTVYY